MINDKAIIIIGASGFGKEVAWLAEECGRKVVGFLDDTKNIGDRVYNYKVIGTVEQYLEFIDNDFIVAIGNPRIRKNIVNGLTRASFTKLIHPAVKLSKAVSIGEGSVICAGVSLTIDIAIGKHCHVNLNCTIGHDCVLKDYITIAPLVALSGSLVVSDGAEVGTGAAVRQGLTIGKGAMIGMGSIVTKNVDDDSIYLGSPAKFFKNIEEF